MKEKLPRNKIHDELFPTPDPDSQQDLSEEWMAAEEEERKAVEEMSKNKEDEFCSHMKSLVEFCKTNRVYFGGCGDCGSPWLECDTCNITVKDASEVF